MPASFVLAREYLDRVPLADKARVSGVVQQAVADGYERAAIKAALRRLAKDSRPVTPDTLRIEIEGKGGAKARDGEVQHLAGGVTLEIVNGTRWYRSPDGRTWAE